MQDNYIPQPLCVDDVRLPDELEPLTEMLAKNVHEVWAKSRIDQGWTYGVQRDDVQKTHPCLVPYEQLPEVEKDYDRHTALETLKFVMKLGYRIIPDRH